MVDAALSLADVEGTYGGKPPVSLNGFDLIWENGAAVHVRPLLMVPMPRFEHGNLRCIHTVPCSRKHAFSKGCAICTQIASAVSEC